jgi:hypothetical protein
MINQKYGIDVNKINYVIELIANLLNIEIIKI